MLLAYQVAIRENVAFTIDDIADYPSIPAGSIMAGNSPIAFSPNSKIAAKRTFTAGNPFIMATFRDPLERLMSLFDFKSDFNISKECSGSVDEEGYHTVVGWLNMTFPGPSLSMCALMRQYQEDQANVLKSGVKPTELLEHFIKKRHPQIMSMLKETQLSWFISRDEVQYTFPVENELSLACAMKSALRTDVLINAERLTDSVIPYLAYHAPEINNLDKEYLEKSMKEDANKEKNRGKQQLSPETLAFIRRQTSFILDSRFYAFADKISKAREKNMFACLISQTDGNIFETNMKNTKSTGGTCSDVCPNVLTEDEWLMIQNAQCEMTDTPRIVDAARSGFMRHYEHAVTAFEYAQNGPDNNAVNGIARVPPV